MFFVSFIQSVAKVHKAPTYATSKKDVLQEIYENVGFRYTKVFNPYGIKLASSMWGASYEYATMQPYLND